MKRLLGATWFALRTTYEEMLPLAGMGLIWAAVTWLLPFGVYWTARALVPFPGLAALLALAPVPPATGALYHVAYQAALGKPVQFGAFWAGFRTYAGLSWRISALLLISGAILAVDIAFYLGRGHILLLLIGILGLWALVFWLAVQVYLFPLMVLQEDKSLKAIVKNASSLTLAFPLFTVGIVAVIALTAAASLLLFVLMTTLWMPFVALLSTRALASSLERCLSDSVWRASLSSDHVAARCSAGLLSKCQLITAR